MVTQVESGALALEDLTPEQRERLRAAVRILIDYLLERASLNGENGTYMEVEGESAAQPQIVPLRLEFELSADRSDE